MHWPPCSPGKPAEIQATVRPFSFGGCNSMISPIPSVRQRWRGKVTIASADDRGFCPQPGSQVAMTGNSSGSIMPVADRIALRSYQSK
jgi:hypothetical protein